MHKTTQLGAHISSNELQYAKASVCVRAPLFMLETTQSCMYLHTTWGRQWQSLGETLAKLKFFSSFRRKHMKKIIIFLLHASWAFFLTPPKFCVLRRGRGGGRAEKGLVHSWSPVQGVRVEGPGIFTRVHICQASFLGFLCVSCLPSQPSLRLHRKCLRFCLESPLFLWACHKGGGGASPPPSRWLTKALLPVVPQSWGAGFWHPWLAVL